MRAIITGGGNGIGKAIVDLSPMPIRNLSRSDHFDLDLPFAEEDVIREFSESNATVLINCYAPLQEKVLQEFLRDYASDSSMTIVNIGSTSKDRLDNTDVDWMWYAADKNKLHFLTKSCQESTFVKCQVKHLTVGLTDTPSTTHKSDSNKLNPNSVAQALWDLVASKENFASILRK